MNDVEALIGRRLGLPATAWPQLRTALTHPSFAHEAADAVGGHYERLEFLGDAAVTLLAAQLCCEAMPEAAEGELSRRRALLVCRDSLAALADGLDLPAHLRRGPSAQAQLPSARLRADVLEAVLGVAYESGGMAAVHRAVGAQLRLALAVGMDVCATDAKSQLQQLCHKDGRAAPTYVVSQIQGPAHARRFVCEVRIGAQLWGQAAAGRKKEAQQACAAAALRRMADANRTEDAP